MSRCAFRRVGLAVVIAILAVWAALSALPPEGRDPQGQDAKSPPGQTTATPQDRTRPATIDRVPAVPEIRWKIVDDRGQPVGNATSKVGASRVASDAQGQSSYHTEASEISVVASAPLHETVETIVTSRGSNVVTLKRILPLRVLAVDSGDRPVSDVDVRITLREFGSPRQLGSPPQVGNSDTRHALTDKDGLAVIDDVAPGVWLIDAKHNELVYSREAQARGASGYVGAVAFMPQQEDVVTIRMVEPCVVAVEVDGGDILSCGFGRRGTTIHSPSNPGGEAAISAKTARLQAEHPKASISMHLLGHPPVDLQSVDVQITVWVAGRRPWQGTLHPVLLRDFRGPTRIALTDMPVSDEFGSAMIHVVGASGRQMADVRLQLLPADPKSPLALFGQTPFSREAAAQGLITLPVGTWRVHIANPFLQKLADGVGPIQIDRGGFREIRIGEAWNWARCRLSSAADTPLAGGSFTITHIESATTVTQMVSDVREGLEMWLPVGRTRLSITARELGRSADNVRILVGQVEAVVEPTKEGVQHLVAPVAPRQ